MKWKLFILLVFFASFVGGCGASRTGHWTKPDFSNQQHEKDVYQCRLDAQLAVTEDRLPFGHTRTRNARQNWFNQCMQSKGYRWGEDK